MTNAGLVRVVGFDGRERSLAADTPCVRMPREDFEALAGGGEDADLRATRVTNISPILTSSDRATYEGEETTLAECADGDTVYVGPSDDWEAARVTR